MDLITPESIRELSMVSVVAGIVLFAVWRGVPALISYLERKDAAHREDILKLVADARDERDAFYANLGIQLTRLHDRFDKLESKFGKANLNPTKTDEQNKGTT